MFIYLLAIFCGLNMCNLHAMDAKAAPKINTEKEDCEYLFKQQETYAMPTELPNDFGAELPGSVASTNDIRFYPRRIQEKLGISFAHTSFTVGERVAYKRSTGYLTIATILGVKNHVCSVLFDKDGSRKVTKAISIGKFESKKQ